MTQKCLLPAMVGGLFLCTKSSVTVKPLKHDLITCFWMLLDFPAKGDKKGTKKVQALMHRKL
nr:MAG TPA: hypothetical protein [Caudoviricetes sp.]